MEREEFNQHWQESVASYYSIVAAMSNDKTAGPSLLLAQHDTAHREHSPLPARRHAHHRLHQEERALTEIIESVLTQVFTTISVIQQINVDTEGHTIGIQTVLADATGGILSMSPILTDSDTSTTTSYPAPTSIESSPTQATSTLVDTASPTSLDIVAVSTSIPSVSSTITPLMTSNSTRCKYILELV